MEKIKAKITNWIESEKGKDILVVLIVILVGLGSFELGRLSKSDRNPGIKIEYPEQALNREDGAVLGAEYSNILPARPAGGQNDKMTNSDSAGKSFFASAKGKKYYPVNCSAGKTIKETNRVWFDTREEAERAGYELSSSCR